MIKIELGTTVAEGLYKVYWTKHLWKDRGKVSVASIGWDPINERNWIHCAHWERSHTELLGPSTVEHVELFASLPTEGVVELPKYRPWKFEEIPDIWYRKKGTKTSFRISSSFDSAIEIKKAVFINKDQLTAEDLLERYECCETRCGVYGTCGVNESELNQPPAIESPCDPIEFGDKVAVFNWPNNPEFVGLTGIVINQPRHENGTITVELDNLKKGFLKAQLCGNSSNFAKLYEGGSSNVS